MLQHLQNKLVMETLMGWPAAHRNKGSSSGKASRPDAGFLAPTGAAAAAYRNYQWTPKTGWKPFPAAPKPPIAPFGKRMPAAAAQVLRSNVPLARLALRGVPVIGLALTLYGLYRLLPPGGRSPMPYNLTGWTQIEYCRPGSAFTNQSSSCTAGNVGAGSGVGPNGISVPPGKTLINFRQPQFTQNVYGRWNFRQASKWTKDYANAAESGTRVAPWYFPYSPPQYHPGGAPHPAFVPAFDPFVIPALFPLPTPSPVPRSAVNTKVGTQAGDWSENGPKPQPAAGGRPRRPTYQPHKKPRENEKEKKSRVRKGFSIALRGGYAATEALDFIEALTDGVFTPWGMTPPAFPEEILRKLPRDAMPHEKAKFIYENWRHLDLDQALVNLALNQVIDIAVGVPQGQLTNWANQHGIIHGPHPFSGPSTFL